MRILLAMVVRARRSFLGSMPLAYAAAILMAVLTGTVAGVLPAVLGQAVTAVAGGGVARRAPGGLGPLLAAIMPAGAPWLVVVVALGATTLTVGVGVLSSRVGSVLSGRVTAALRIELLRSVLGASSRAVAEAGQAIMQLGPAPGRPPGPGGRDKGSPPARVTGPSATGDAAVRIAVSREAALISDFSVSVATGLPQSLATLVVLTIELMTTGAWLVLAGGVALFVLSRLLADRASRRVAGARQAMQNADAAVFANLQQTLQASEDLRLWGARGQAVREFAMVAQACARSRARFAAALAVAGQVRSVLTAMAPLLIIVTLQISGRRFDAGEVAKLLLLVPLLMARLEAMDAMRQGFIQREPVLRAGHRVLALPPAPPPPAEPLRLELGEVAGGIRFAEVSFTPPGAERPIIDSVSLEVPPGSVVGICGPSGSGKSTLLRLLLRLDEPDTGRIELDGHDLASLDPEQLPALFGVVRQVSRLLERPVGENLALGLEPPPEPARMRAALRAVQMDELADGQGERTLATPYRATPPSLSGGECRRLLLARMLLGGAPIGVLDEPEAGLPSATAEQILRAVTEQAGGRTQLVVTHAPQLLDSDFNAVMVAGKLVATGTHEELLASCAPYRALIADAS